jgi:sulfoquinovosidase
MAPIPAWVQQGAIIGIVNGQDFVDEQYTKMKDAGLPMVGMWMQDWVGEHTFPEGTRLLWNWQLNRDWYYDWDSMCDSWASDGVVPFVYINPYIADLSNFEGVTLRQDQYAIGVANNYFVKNSEGETYQINSISINFAMIDLTNPDAWQWTKDLIKINLVDEGRAGGWMHDFGEYLPFDAVLFSGVDPIAYHNQYAADWAAVVKEALSEVRGGEDIMYWMRSATGLSPKDTGIYWMGDQLVSFDKYDGMQSAMIG